MLGLFQLGLYLSSKEARVIAVRPKLKEVSLDLTSRTCCGMGTDQPADTADSLLLDIQNQAGPRAKSPRAISPGQCLSIRSILILTLHHLDLLAGF